MKRIQPTTKSTQLLSLDANRGGEGTTREMKSFNDYTYRSYTKKLETTKPSLIQNVMDTK